jgi:hypothetical protein
MKFLMDKAIQLYKKVYTVTWLRAGQCRVRIPTGMRNWPFIKLFRPTLAPYTRRFIFYGYRRPFRRKFDRSVEMITYIHPVPTELQEWVALYLNTPYIFRACRGTTLSLFNFMVTKGVFNLSSSWENVRFSEPNLLHVVTYYCSILLLITVESFWKYDGRQNCAAWRRTGRRKRRIKDKEKASFKNALVILVGIVITIGIFVTHSSVWNPISPVYTLCSAPYSVFMCFVCISE